MSQTTLIVSKSLKPSQTLISRGDNPGAEYRIKLLDACAETIEDVFNNRSDQCLTFALLVQYGLSLEGMVSEVYIGKAKYLFRNGECKNFSWDHAWVMLGDDIIDGNVDSFVYNPKIPSCVRQSPYWGPKKLLASYRKLKPYGRVEEYPELMLQIEREFATCKQMFRKKMSKE